MKKRNEVADRYSARLLFQFRVLSGAKSNTMRLCEERTVVFRSASARAALSIAKRKGRDAQFDYRNSAGNKVIFEFIGVMGLLCLGPECDEDEVWYELKVMKRPKERARSIVPAERDLKAIYWEDGGRARRSKP